MATKLDEEHERMKGRILTMRIEDIENLALESAKEVVSEIMSVIKKHSASLPSEFLLDLEMVFDTVQTKGEV